MLTIGTQNKQSQIFDIVKLITDVLEITTLSFT